MYRYSVDIASTAAGVIAITVIQVMVCGKSTCKIVVVVVEVISTSRI